MFWEEKAPQRNNLAIPPEFSQIYKLARISGMGPDHLDNIMQLTLEHMPQKMRENSETIKRYFQVLLRKMVPIRREMEIQKGSKRLMMFVGPTGVGKTTTIAKLAARYSYLKEKREKVGIITLDTYRIGAVEQLFQYAKMMRLPIEDVVDPADFNNALRSLNHCDLILIDTVGSSQYDKEKLMKLNRFVQNSEYQIDVNLVLSAGSKLEDLKDIYKNFSFLDIDTLIFTKFDETKVFGTVFSLIYDIDKPVSYFSIGQEVPDDLVVASSDFLVECMLDGFKRKADAKSSK
jgi:flagellar biosynthesis protein FlhF